MQTPIPLMKKSEPAAVSTVKHMTNPIIIRMKPKVNHAIKVFKCSGGGDQSFPKFFWFYVTFEFSDSVFENGSDAVSKTDMDDVSFLPDEDGKSNESFHFRMLKQSVRKYAKELKRAERIVSNNKGEDWYDAAKHERLRAAMKGMNDNFKPFVQQAQQAEDLRSFFGEEQSEHNKTHGDSDPIRKALFNMLSKSK